MTSDRSLDPFLRQLEDFSDEVFRGQSTPANDLDSATRGAVHRLRAIDRIPSFDQTRMQTRKDELMTYATSWPLATEPLMPAAQGANGTHPIPIPMPARPSIQPRRSLLLPLVSAAVLLALIGGLIFGIVQNRGGESEPTLPAFVQGTPSPEQSPALGANWGQYRGGIARTGYTSDAGPGANANLLWSFSSEEWLNAVAESDGKVFAFGDKGGLYAIDARTGNQLWAIDLDENQVSDALMVPGIAVGDGTVYVSTSTSTLVAADADSGDVRWQTQLGSPNLWTPTYAEGRVYATVDEARMIALDADTGDELWSWDFPGGATQQYPTIADGKLFIADQEFGFYAIDLTTGQTVWSTADIGAVRVSAYQDGTLFVPGWDGRVTAIDAATGTVRWVNTDGSTAVLAPILTDDMLIVVNELETARALDPATGNELWSIPAAGVGSPPHASGNTLYLETMPGVYTAFDLVTGERTGRTEGAYGAGLTNAISGNMLFVSGMTGPIRAYVPYAVIPTDVQVGIPDPAPSVDSEVKTPPPGPGNSSAH